MCYLNCWTDTVNRLTKSKEVISVGGNNNWRIQHTRQEVKDQNDKGQQWGFPSHRFFYLTGKSLLRVWPMGMALEWSECEEKICDLKYSRFTKSLFHRTCKIYDCDRFSFILECISFRSYCICFSPLYHTRFCSFAFASDLSFYTTWESPSSFCW